MHKSAQNIVYSGDIAVGFGLNAELSAGIVETEIYDSTTAKFSSHQEAPDLSSNDVSRMRRSFAQGYHQGNPLLVGGTLPCRIIPPGLLLGRVLKSFTLEPLLDVGQWKHAKFI